MTQNNPYYNPQNQPDEPVRPAFGQPAPVQPQPYMPNPSSEWSPYGASQQYTRHTGGQEPYGGQSEPPRKSSGGKAARTVAMLLACAVVGFGGGYVANSISATPGTTVVYKAPEADNITPASAGDSLSVSEIAAKAGQSVVSVVTKSGPASPYMNDQTATGAGSGVIISEDGYIITNHHVVEDAASVYITLPDGSEHEATIVGSDARSDIAVLKINVKGLIPAVIGNNEEVRVGDFVIAIGNPMGQLGGTVTDGIVSALNREVNIAGTPMNLIQMSAAVSPGNSGGGLFNGKGELVGVVNAKAGSSEAEGLGFAIPAGTAMQVAEELMEGGYVKGRPALGITAQQVNVQGSDTQTAVVIAQVTPGGAAEVAGLQQGDVLLSLEGEEVSTLAGLSAALDGYKVGDTVQVEVQRGEEKIVVSLELQELVPVTTTVGA